MSEPTSFFTPPVTPGVMKSVGTAKARDGYVECSGLRVFVGPNHHDLDVCVRLSTQGGNVVEVHAATHSAYLFEALRFVMQEAASSPSGGPKHLQQFFGHDDDGFVESLWQNYLESRAKDPEPTDDAVGLVGTDDLADSPPEEVTVELVGMATVNGGELDVGGLRIKVHPLVKEVSVFVVRLADHSVSEVLIAADPSPNSLVILVDAEP